MRRLSHDARRAIVAGLLILASALWLGVQTLQRGSTPEQGGPAQTLLPPTGAYSLYFTNPGGPNAVTLRGGPDAALAAAIDEAQQGVDLAIFELNLWSVRDALIGAHERGVEVRVVTDSDSLDYKELQELIAAGIPVVDDRNDGLMHHKFAVIDEAQVWTGSMNLTVNGAYRNDNNLLMFRSLELAQAYRQEFEEMFLEHRFGIFSAREGAFERVQIGELGIEVLFSPDNEVAARLVQVLSGAERSIHFLAFSLTLDSLSGALIERAQSGVLVQGVVDQGQAVNPGNDLEALGRAGVEVHLDGNPAKMHHKVMIIDARTVITGSYNFSRSAEERNDENVLILHSPELASQYLIEFERVRNQATR